MQIKLTPSFVLKAAAEPGKDRSIYWDTGMEGFGLMVLASGRRSYVVQYRNAAGRSRRMTLKSVLKLAPARKEAMSFLSAAAKGADPLAERRKMATEPANTLKAIGDSYLARATKGLRSVSQRRDHLTRLIYPTLGKLQIDAIRRSDIVRMLDKIEDQNGPCQADAVLASLRTIMGWHAGRSDDFRSPIVRGMARSNPGERRRRRILSDDELRAVWKAAGESTGAFDYFVRFVLLTACRRTEAARMTRQELSSGDWVIPAARSKSGKDFVVPLSGAAAAVLASVPAIGRKGLVFSTDGEHPISGFSKFKSAFDERCGVTGWTIHDLRRTARSLMSRAGADPDHSERALGHAIGGIRGVYDLHQYRDEKLAVLETLAAQIDRIVHPEDNVVMLKTNAT